MLRPILILIFPDRTPIRGLNNANGLEYVPIKHEQQKGLHWHYLVSVMFATPQIINIRKVHLNQNHVDLRLTLKTLTPTRHAKEQALSPPGRAPG